MTAQATEKIGHFGGTPVMLIAPPITNEISGTETAAKNGILIQGMSSTPCLPATIPATKQTAIVNR